MRLFHFERREDESGVSGTGIVAQGVVFDNGWCALTWLTEHTSVAFYTSISEVEAIHGHNGKTRIVFPCSCCGHDEAGHIHDNCGGCEVAGCYCASMNHHGGAKWSAHCLPPVRR